METVFIKFEPEALMEVSVRLEQQHKRFIQSSDAIKNKSENLLGSWQSDSSARYIEKIRQLDAQSAVLAETLLSLSRDLASASGIYKAGEAEAKQKAEALPTDGVFLV